MLLKEVAETVDACGYLLESDPWKNTLAERRPWIPYSRKTRHALDCDSGGCQNVLVNEGRGGPGPRAVE